MLRIKELREEKKWSQQQLADHMGLQQQTVQRHENEVNEPDLITLIKYADVFGVSLDYFTCRSKLKTDLLNDAEQGLLDSYRHLPVTTAKTVHKLLSQISNTGK